MTVPEDRREDLENVPVGKELVPRPDPTRLTTAMLRREISNLREIIETRMDAMDKATILRLNVMEQQPEAVRQEVGHLEKVVNQKFATVEEKLKGSHKEYHEKFSAITNQFAERDTRLEQYFRSSKEALEVALQAAKELVNAHADAASRAAQKSEDSFTKQIDQIGKQLETVGSARDARITELKERIDRAEGQNTGALDQRHEARAAGTLTVGMASAYIASAALIVAIITVVAIVLTKH